MKRNILYVSLAAALATTSLSGCIDNDEPDGILALRQAKASYINAQAANETTLANADAAYKAAETAVKAAEAKQAEAVAKKAEYEAALAEYEAKLAEAKTEAEIAAVKAQLEVSLQQLANDLQTAKAEAEQLAQKAQTELNNLKASYNTSLAALEKSTAAYAEALKQIKTQETVLDTKSGSYITIAEVYNKYLDSKNEYKDATEAVADASVNYIHALYDTEVETNELLNELDDALKDAKLEQQAAERVLEVKQAELEAAKNKGLMTEAEYTDKVNELDAQISALGVKIAENLVAQEKFAVEPMKQEVELQNQINELNDQLTTTSNAASETIYPNNESLNAIQAKINEAEAEITALEDDFNDAKEAIAAEKSYWGKQIQTWNEISVNKEYTRQFLSEPVTLPLAVSIFKFNEDENKIVVKAGLEDYYTNGSIISSTVTSYSTTYLTDSEISPISVGYTAYIPKNCAESFAALRKTIDNVCAAYANLGKTTSDSKIYKAASSIKSELDKIYNKAKETSDGFDEKVTELTTAYNTTTLNQVLEIENVTIPALQKELDAATKVISDQIDALTDQKDAIATTDPELVKEEALLSAEKSALESVKNVYKTNMLYLANTLIESLEEDVVDAEEDLEDAKMEVTNAQYQIDLVKSVMESSDFNPYNQAVKLAKFALDNATEDLQEAQENLEYYDSLFKSSVEALSSSAE